MKRRPQPPAGISRRDFLLSSAALGASASLTCRAPARLAKRDDLVELSATEAVRALKNGDVRAEEYASALLERCEAGDHLNAFITLEPERVLEAARAADRKRDSGAALGPLHGLPVPIKDSVNTRDLPTTGGTPALRSFRPRADAPIVRALLEAGAIVLGKTNIHELSFGWTSNNLAFGPVRNPYDPTRIPGGSTGGTAAAVAARMAPLGVAEDTEGSIRVPAAMCGIAGFRPTTGRYPSQGVVPITPHFDQVGPHARTVLDLVLFDSVVTGDERPIEPAPLSGKRLGVDRGYFFESLDPEVERLTEEALAKLRDAGVVIVEAEVPDLARFVQTITAPVQYHDVVPMLTRYLAEYEAGISFEELFAMASTDIREEFEIYSLPGAERAISEEAYRAAIDLLPALEETYRSYFRENDVDAIVFPTTLVPAPPIGQDRELEIRGEKVSFVTAVSRNIGGGSTAGIPGLVLPSGLTREGLPASLELDGPEGEDRSLLALGVSVEKVLGPLPPPRVEG